MAGKKTVAKSQLGRAVLSFRCQKHTTHDNYLCEKLPGEAAHTVLETGAKMLPWRGLILTYLTAVLEISCCTVCAS